MNPATGKCPYIIGGKINHGSQDNRRQIGRQIMHEPHKQVGKQYLQQNGKSAHRIIPHHLLQKTFLDVFLPVPPSPHAIPTVIIECRQGDGKEERKVEP